MNHIELLKNDVSEWNKLWKNNNKSSLKLNRANLKDTNLNKALLSYIFLVEANLTRADLSDAILNCAYLRKANLQEANLAYAQCRWADFGEADLSGANLESANLEECDFSSANLTGANLRNTKLKGAKLRKANLSNAFLENANLIEANLSGAVLRNTNFNKVVLSSTILNDIDFTNTLNLEKVIHCGPSSIGIDTFYKSSINTPLTFLKGVGILDIFIEYMKSLTTKSFEYYSCFISYSSVDEEFAKRLHADLQDNSVRCWFAPEDFKIGEKIRDSIDEAIRYRDKLLIVLSKNSILSNWVEKEIETAFEEERKRNSVVLFPVRIDNSVMETDQAWAADIRRQRHIGDFSDWKNHDSYIKAFERLLRDLRT